MAEPASEPSLIAAPGDNSEQSNERLRRQLRDTSALLALPALWRGQNPQQIATSLLDVLVSLLRADLAHMQVGASSRGTGSEHWFPRRPEQPEIVTHAFVALEPAQPTFRTSIPHPFATGALHLMGMRIDVLDDDTRVVVGANRVDFPTEHERFLFRSAIEQATVAIANARLYEQAQHAIGLRDEFFSVAAHELRTPMTSLRAAVQLLQRIAARGETLAPDLVDRHLRTIDQQSKRLVQLIVQLLDVTRMETGKLTLELQMTDLVKLAQMVISNLQTTTEHHQLVLLHPGDPTPPILALIDPLRMEQVLVNLLDNAIKYSPDGGSVDVSIQQPAPEMVQITVRDHGIGIPPARRGQIFDRFFQAHLETHRSGMGLGLYISSEIIYQHAGQITAEFPDDGGTRFVVTLPTDQDRSVGVRDVAGVPV